MSITYIFILMPSSFGDHFENTKHIKKYILQLFLPDWIKNYYNVSFFLACTVAEGLILCWVRGGGASELEISDVFFPPLILLDLYRKRLCSGYTICICLYSLNVFLFFLIFLILLYFCLYFHDFSLLSELSYLSESLKVIPAF